MTPEHVSTPLAGRVAIVTGASRGIGASIAATLADAGAAVGLVARPSELLQSRAFAIVSSAGRAVAVEADLLDPERSADVVQEVERTLGPVDILVNNAAIQRFSPITETTTADFAESITVNLIAPFAMSRAVLPGMIARRRGWIVNIASDLAYRSITTGAAYCASKRGLVALSECIQLEHMGNGIRVSVLMPGAVATEWDGLPPDHPSKDGHMRPQEVADAVLWCCTRPIGSRVDVIEFHPMSQES